MTTLYRDALGYAIRAERMMQGRSLRDIAAAAPLALAYLSEVERGCNDVSSEMLQRIARGLFMTVGEISIKAAQVMLEWEQQEFEEIVSENLERNLTIKK